MKRISRYCTTFMLYSAAAIMAVGCAGVQENVFIEQAREALNSAQGDAAVMKYAPLELQRAKKSFEQAENSWKSGANELEVEHLAYLSKQKTAMARETATMKETEKYIENVNADRSQVLLDARTRETERALGKAEKARMEAEEQRRAAELALQEAEAKRAEAEKARMEADEAAEKAKRLEAQIAELQAAQSERGLVMTLGDVLFDVDKSDLRPGAFYTMDKLATFLKEYPKRIAQVEGFTDSTGSDEYNRRLSERRAESVRNALIYRGVEPTRIVTRGYGETFPVTTNDTPDGRQRNRRVEIIISDDKGVIPDRRY